MADNKVLLEFEEEKMNLIKKRANQKHMSVEEFINYCIDKHVDTRKAVISRLLHILPFVLAIIFSTLLVMYVIFFSHRNL